MNETIEFYWDIGSTNTYFAFHLLRPLAARYEVGIDYRPFNLGYVFRHHNYALSDEPVAKMRNRKRDLMRWATRYDLAFRIPDEFPIKTSRALRGALVMREYGLEEAYMDALFRRYWEDNDASIVHYAGLARTCAALGVDADAFAVRAESAEIRQQAETITREGLEMGVFGAPTMVVAGEIYWGKDRFEFIESQLATLRG